MTRFSQAALDALMPMHVVIGPTGHIVSAGPTIRRLCTPGNFVGRRLAEVFELRKPQVHDARMDSLRALAGERLLLQLRQAPRTQFKGILVPADGDASLLLNLSFGIGAMAAVQDHDLNNADFAPTDLTIEMLYLHEAKRVLDGEFRRVNARLESSRDKAHFQAMTDALTGLRNRRAMEAELALAIEARTHFSLFQVDLDLFKQINDTLGHAAGDRVLEVAAKRMLANTRDVDIVTRVGGDEFVILGIGLIERDRLAKFATELISDLERPIDFEGQDCHISASIGFTISTIYKSPDADQMMADADAALYAVKRAGRGHALVFDPKQHGADIVTAAE